MEAAIKEYRPKLKRRKDDFWKALGLPRVAPSCMRR